MHWAVGLVIGVLLAIFAYFVYLFLMSKTVKGTKTSLDQTPPAIPSVASNPPTPRNQPPVRTALTKIPGPVPPVPAYPRLPMFGHHTPVRPTQPALVEPQEPKVPARWKMKNLAADDEAQEAKLPEQEEYNEIRIFDISSLPYTSDDLNIKNCISAELVRAVIPRGEYTIDETENEFTITGPNGSSTLELTVQDYTITELASAIQTAVQGTGVSVFADASLFTVTYNTGTSTITIAHSTPEEFTIVTDSHLAYSLGFASSTIVSSSGTTTGSNRVDLFGNRTVQIRTTEFGPEHHNNILQNIHVADELTLWENTLDPRLTERRFRQPRNVGQLHISILSRHPSETLETDYKQLALNGVVAHLTICFRCVRYSINQITSKTLDLS